MRTVDIHRAILETLCYFDLFSYPLTREEVYRWLWQPPSFLSYEQFLSSLSDLVSQGVIGQRNGFFFLRGRDKTVKDRQSAVAIVEEKLQIAKRAINLLRWIPWVEAVCVCNSTAFGMARPGSDIDVFIIGKPGFLWLTRFWSICILALTGHRMTKKTSRDKICLSFFAASDALDFQDVASSEQDIYFAYWLTLLLPIYDPHGWHETIQKENMWVARLIPFGFSPTMLHPRAIVELLWRQKWFHFFCRQIFRVLSKKWLERMARRIQLPLLIRRYRGRSFFVPTAVIISDTRLKFHENDRRAFFRESWEKRCEEVIGAWKL